MSGSLEESLELSALLTRAQTDAAAILELLSSDEFPIARACARNAVQALAACEENLREGGPPVSD